MRALRTNGQTLEMSLDTPDPVLAPGEALIQPTRVLLTAADLAHAQSRSRQSFTGTIGHLFTGVVRQIDLPKDSPAAFSSRRGLQGRRVVVAPVVACGHCDLCRGGLSAHCRARQVPGIAGRDGGCAELVSMPLANLHAIPETLTDDRAVFAPLVASVLHTAHMLRAQHRAFVTVLGDSILAALAAQYLAGLNKTVRLLSDDHETGRLCEKWGVKHRPLNDPGRRQDQDAVVDCTGSADGLRLAMQMVKPRGVIMLKSSMADVPYPAGKPFPEASEPWTRGVDLTPVVANELQLIGSRDGPLPEALAVLVAGTIDVTPLLGRRFRLDQALNAFGAAGSTGPMGVLIEDLGRAALKAA